MEKCLRPSNKSAMIITTKWFVWWKIFLKMANGLSWNGKTLLDFVDADFFM